MAGGIKIRFLHLTQNLRVVIIPKCQLVCRRNCVAAISWIKYPVPQTASILQGHSMYLYVKKFTSSICFMLIHNYMNAITLVLWLDSYFKQQICRTRQQYIRSVFKVIRFIYDEDRFCAIISFELFSFIYAYALCIYVRLCFLLKQLFFTITLHCWQVHSIFCRFNVLCLFVLLKIMEWYAIVIQVRGLAIYKTRLSQKYDCWFPFVSRVCFFYLDIIKVLTL